MTTYKNREAAIKFLGDLKLNLKDYMDKMVELRKGEGALPSVTMSNEQLQNKTMGKAELDKCGQMSGAKLEKDENSGNIKNRYIRVGNSVRHSSTKDGKPHEPDSYIGDFRTAKETQAFIDHHNSNNIHRSQISAKHPGLNTKKTYDMNGERSSIRGNNDSHSLKKSVFGGGSRLGGRDSGSKMMTTQALHQGAKDAMKNAQMPTNQQTTKMPSMAQHQDRASMFGDFMPAGKWNKSEMQKSLDEMGKFSSKFNKSEEEYQKKRAEWDKKYKSPGYDEEVKRRGSQEHQYHRVGNQVYYTKLGEKARPIRNFGSVKDSQGFIDEHNSKNTHPKDLPAQSTLHTPFKRK